MLHSSAADDGRVATQRVIRQVGGQSGLGAVGRARKLDPRVRSRDIELFPYTAFAAAAGVEVSHQERSEVRREQRRIKQPKEGACCSTSGSNSNKPKHIHTERERDRSMSEPALETPKQRKPICKERQPSRGETRNQPEAGWTPACPSHAFLLAPSSNRPPRGLLRRPTGRQHAAPAL
jgi:hypothetical protein